VIAKPLKQKKPKACKVCKGPIKPPSQPMAKVCCWQCAQSLAVSVRGKAEKVAAIREKRADKVKLDAMKSMGKLIEEAQRAFNSFIRARDEGKPCICCGRAVGPQRPGGNVDAGHYLSRGSSPHLRFDERNVHAQRKDCNRPGGAKRASFRAGMLERIGLEALEALECDQTLKHYTRDDVVQIKTTYAARARELKKAMI
jgi:Bacteriophage Lambda NinG protein